MKLVIFKHYRWQFYEIYFTATTSILLMCVKIVNRKYFNSLEERHFKIFNISICLRSIISHKESEILKSCNWVFIHSGKYFWSRRACVRHPWWRTKRSWPLFSPTFFFFFLFLFFLSTPSAFHPLRGISRA